MQVRLKIIMPPTYHQLSLRGACLGASDNFVWTWVDFFLLWFAWLFMRIHEEFKNNRTTEITLLSVVLGFSSFSPLPVHRNLGGHVLPQDRWCVMNMQIPESLVALDDIASCLECGRNFIICFWVLRKWLVVEQDFEWVCCWVVLKSWAHPEVELSWLFNWILTPRKFRASVVVSFACNLIYRSSCLLKHHSFL